MNQHSTTRGLPTTLATIAVLLSACTGDPTTTTDEGPSISASSADDERLAAAPPTPVGTEPPLGTPRAFYYDKGEFVHDEGERNVRVSPGVYAVPFSGWGDLPPEVADLRAVISFPAGFQSLHRSTFAKNGSGASVREFGFWTVDRVPSDFCAGVDSPASLPNPGPTVADLATALATQPRLAGTDPIAVTIGGHDGLYVELTRPTARCRGQVLWFAPRIAHAAYHDRFNEPGDVARLWILDVDGRRVVIDTIHSADASDADVAELTRMVESATFVHLGGRGEPAIPSAVHDPVGDGGLEPERDLAVGRASVAIANSTAAFVITADDGVYHRLDLPGFEPALYDAGSDVTGLALSPDGTHLIYGWQGASARPKASGARLVDLLTGKVVTLDRQALYDEPARLLPWGFSWSPDSRFVINRVKIADPDDPWASSPHWQQGFDTATGRTFGFDERFAGLELEADDELASTARVSSSRLEARNFADDVDLWMANHGAGIDDLPKVRTDPAADPATEYEVWVTGQFDASGTRLLLEPDRVAASLALVAGLDEDGGRHDPTTTVLRLTDGPADVLLLGWVGHDHALAVMDNDFSDSVSDLVLLALDAEVGQADGTVVGHLSVTDSDLSFATDLASVTTPTRDFEADPAIEDGAADDSTPGSTRQSSGLPTTALVGGGAALLALAAALAVTVRRRRAAANPN